MQDQVVLRWTDIATNETGYTVQRASNQTFTTSAIPFDLPAGAVSYTDSPLTRLATYYYQVRANNVAGSSSWSTFRIVTP